MSPQNEPSPRSSGAPETTLKVSPSDWMRIAVQLMQGPPLTLGILVLGLVAASSRRELRQILKLLSLIAGDVRYWHIGNIAQVRDMGVRHQFVFPFDLRSELYLVTHAHTTQHRRVGRELYKSPLSSPITMLASCLSPQTSFPHDSSLSPSDPSAQDEVRPLPSLGGVPCRRNPNKRPLSLQLLPVLRHQKHPFILPGNGIQRHADPQVRLR